MNPDDVDAADLLPFVEDVLIDLLHAGMVSREWDEGDCAWRYRLTAKGIARAAELGALPS